MTVPFVQDQVFDTFGARYLGQLNTFRDNHNSDVESYISETITFVGRGVVRGALTTAIDHVSTPFNITAAVPASVSANIVGVVVQSQRASLADQTTNAPIIPTDSMTGVAPLGSGLRIGVAASVTITHGQAVFMAVNATNAAGISVGEFHNVAGAGLVAVTGATWYGAATAGSVGLIEV